AAPSRPPAGDTRRRRPPRHPAAPPGPARAGPAPRPGPPGPALPLVADPTRDRRGADGMSVQLTWIGQAGFLLRTPGTRLALDPFLSDHPDRRFPAPRGGGRP